MQTEVADFDSTAGGRRELLYFTSLSRVQRHPAGGRRQKKRKLNTCSMKKVFTAAQISDWFTSGTAFANVKLTEEVVERKSDETSPKESRWGEVKCKVAGLTSC